MFTSTLLRPPGRQLLSQQLCIAIPPHTSSPRRRAFHASAPRRAIGDAILYLPHELLQCLHIGLPWYAALPVSAFIVRGLLVTSVGSRVRALQARYHGLMPLRQAMSLQIGDELMRKGNFKTPKQAHLTINRAIKKETGALNRRWDCTLWGQTGWTIAQLPLFLMMAEVVRRMSGIKTGLLGMAMHAVGLSSSTVENAQTPGLGSFYSTDAATNPWFEASLANEGVLWFSDLLVADPTHVLPFAVSALMFTNLYISKNGSVGTPNRLQRIIRRTLLTVSLMIGPLCIDVPASLLLYWASSTSSVIVWNAWLDRKYPIAPGFEPCKRKLLVLGRGTVKGK